MVIFKRKRNNAGKLGSYPGNLRGYCLLESKYARSGYRISTLAKILHTSEKEINQWFLGKLPELRASEIEEELDQANVIV